MSPEVVAYVGIGSNLQHPSRQVQQAVTALAKLPGSRLDAVSSWYRSPPMGPADQPDYINGVAALKTGLEVYEFFDHLQRIESNQGRKRGQRWGPRTLDLDLLVYGDLQIDTMDLVVPHPGIAERAFVVVPLAEIAPDARIPGLGSVSSLYERLPLSDRQSLEPVLS